MHSTRVLGRLSSSAPSSAQKRWTRATRQQRAARVSAEAVQEGRKKEENELRKNKSSRRALLGLGVTFAGVAAGGAAVVSSSSPALALGPTDVILDIIDFKDVECAEGVPKGARCIEVRAKGELKSKQPAYNGEVFGKVRYKGSDESAVYGDYAEASDAGKIGDIDEIPPGKSELKFNLLLQPNPGEVVFINPKIRVYPGMRKDFRIMKPVSETLDVCDPDYDLCD
mmetsp:Transcript_15772/g.45063  ORF Transcript_15772/g.45063 Transcript_15772/m.45063 type:complete len:226 (-) Transcript_15772:398-1075(-)